MTKKIQKSTKNKVETNKAPSFEKALERLEEIVNQLEGAEAPLEKALSLYEEGVGLARTCSTQLKAAERKVELLEDKGTKLRSRPFEDELNGASASKIVEDEDEDDDENESDKEDEEGDEDEDEDEDQESLF